MCFAPWVSLTTAVVEFVVASFILIRYKNYLVPVFSAIFVYVLGLYQFTEFMLCVSGNPFLWARIGFVVYSFLPAIGLHMAFRFIGIKFRNWMFYIIPIMIFSIAFLKDDFVIRASCSYIYVYVLTFLYSGEHLILSIIYLLYYFGFIALIGIILILHLKKKAMVKIYYFWIIFGIITVSIPVFLILIFPSLGLAFPSVYCEFALGYTIAAVLGSRIYYKEKQKEKF
ncbi:MAG: hypothetical protein V1888_01575 [archaeon]